MADPIRFYKGEETGIVHENYHDIDTSLFKDQYFKALNEIGAYMLAGKEFTNKDLNNIFAFIGERGTGKTSCMESVSCLLDEISINKDAEKKLTIEEQKKLEIVNKKYLSLPIVDPTIFDNNTNLMQVVIGVMFEKFKDKVANLDSLPYSEDRDVYEKNKQNLLKAFQDVKECIKYISNPDLLKCEDDDISQLAGMASVSKLNDRIGKLSDRYLEFFDKNILVLQIDDIDLQTKYAYQMVEEIRKYFMHKNIIILMAVKMEQLAKVIENETAKQYEPLKKLEGITLPEVSDMAIRYLLKLIPINHRIYMPTTDVYMDIPLEYYDIRGPQGKLLINRVHSVKYTITTLIFEKCRFLFYHSKGITSPIVPTNLRELRHLFAMLFEMPKYGNSEIESNKSNKNKFLHYLYNSWAGNNLNNEDYKIAEDIISIRDAGVINKIVLQLLNNKYHKSILKIEEKPSEELPKDKAIIKEILNVKNASYNISIGDVYVIIDYIKHRISSRSDKMLIFFIETFYSIKLYEYYDELTYPYHKEYPQEQITEEERIDKSIIKREIVDGISNYEVLVGGSFINTEMYKLLADEGSYLINRGSRHISYSVLKSKAKELSSQSQLDIQQLQIVELLALCVSRILEYKNSTIENKANREYRQSNDLYYKFPNDRNNIYIQFDLGAFFFNIIDIERAYNRIDDNLFEIAKGNDDSLYNQLIKKCKNLKSDTYDEQVDIENLAAKSCFAIRNFEILEDFMTKIQYERAGNSESSSNLVNILNFFGKVAGYNINTYDRDGENSPQKIGFEYARVINNLFS